MADRHWKILLVEDDEDDFVLTRDMLVKSSASQYTLDWARTYAEGLRKALEQSFDTILMDYELGFHTGLDLTRELSNQGIRAPVILLTGRGNYNIDLEAMQVGATDYLAKSEATPASLERSIRYAISQKQGEEELRNAKQDLEARVQERTSELTQKNKALEHEIAGRKRIEAELAEMRRLLINRMETERLELARDLHDGPMQELYGLVFQLDTINGNLTETTEARAFMKEKILELIQSLREISRELRPPALAPYGLEKAIRSHVESFQAAHTDLEIHLELESDAQTLPEPVRLALFRIYQTSITNVIRHSRASQAVVRLQLSNDQVRLEVQDNGCGFHLPKSWLELARQDHLGLVGAVERAEAAGGRLEVQSRPGEGTLIRAVIPRELSNGFPPKEDL